MKIIYEWLRSVKQLRKWTQSSIIEFAHYAEAKVLEVEDEICTDNGFYIFVHGEINIEGSKVEFEPKIAFCQDNDYIELKKVVRVPYKATIKAIKKSVIAYVNEKNMKYILKAF